MSSIGFGRKVFGQRGLANPQRQTQQSGGIFSGREERGGASPFDRHFDQAEHLARGTNFPRPTSKCHDALEFLSPEERGELLADLVDRPGLFDGHMQDKSMQEQVVYKTLEAIWQRDIEVRKENLSGLLSLLVGNKRFRENTWYVKPFDTLMKLIDSAIKQGAYLSTGDCAALAEMATDIRSGHRTYRKADTKKMIARAEPVETLAGAAPANIPDV